jgi:ABC-type transport system involved in cytochrome c biogenesis ATPase subunit
VLAVDDLSFTVEPGRVTGFLGPNGSGKTTTLRMLLGLVHPIAGTATIGGQATTATWRTPPSTVGAVLEATSFHPARRARTHLRMAARAGGHDEARADEVLGLVGLTGDAKRKVGGFSMGMRQRLELATALIGDPDVLILDEPSNGLDPRASPGCATSCATWPARAAPCWSRPTCCPRWPRPSTTRHRVPRAAQGAGHARVEITGHHRPPCGPAPPRPTASPVLTQAGIALPPARPDEVAMDGVTPEQVGPLLASNQIVLYELARRAATSSPSSSPHRRARLRRRGGGANVINACDRGPSSSRCAPCRASGSRSAWPSR